MDDTSVRNLNIDRVTGVGAARWGRYVFGYTLATALVAVAVRFAWRDWNLLLRLVSAGPWWMMVISLVGASLVARAYFLNVLVKELGGRVGGRECFCLVAATNMLSMLTPPPTGGAYRAFYLRSRHGIDVMPFASGTALYVVVGVLVWCMVGTIGLIGSGIYTGTVSKLPLIVGLAGTAILIATWRGKEVVQLISNDRLSRIADGTLRVMSSKWIGTAACIAAVGSAAAQVVGFYVVLRLFGLSIDVSNSMSILAFHQLSGIISLTPGGVGIQEGAGVLVASVLGLDITEMVVVFALIRVARIASSILVGGVCWWLLPAEKTFPSPYKN